ncbi:MAG: hypothetical protein ACYDHA_08810 [Bellilinea sp.]
MKARLMYDTYYARLRRKFKRYIPSPILKQLDKKKRKNNDHYVAQLYNPATPPWSSPNIWEEIVQYYQKIENPVIFEYGTGSSSLCHFENLVKKGGGIFIGVETNPDWFWALIGAMAMKASQLGSSLTITKSLLSGEPAAARAIDVSIRTESVQANIKLRTEAKEYVAALDQSCDVIIIDGAYRRLCVNTFLETGHLKPGGLLMLMEAGRGSPDWWEGKLYGEADYSAEVEKLLALGGVLMDGNGLDSWPNCQKRSPNPPSYFYPMEACKLIYPLGKID